jgi:hypothetical protein
MNINAKIVADSIDPRGNRITSMLITFPRFILAELNTHRMLSKNSASSRAIPFNKMVESVQNNPFIPIAWQKDHKGMQGTEYITDSDRIQINNEEPHSYTKDWVIHNWLLARDYAVNQATSLYKMGITKQICNRLLEPFMWHTVLVTATEWENFFALRCPQYILENIPTVDENLSLSQKTLTLLGKSKKDLLKDINEIDNDSYTGFKAIINSYNDLDWLSMNKGQAEIHMMALAEAMWDAMNESTPKYLQPGEWHIPFRDEIDAGDIVMITKDGSLMSMEESYIKISTAMSARTSYTVVGDEKEFTYEKQIELHDRMVNAVPFHASPFEHCARAMTNEEYNTFIKGKSIYEEATNSHIPIGDSLGWCRNYRGFIMYRELLENEK